ncbi:calcium-binding protein [Paracoccus litorisediminis]|uniref:calcium-binding protein n=1 Tax=Paracoccus litorisediminis TaxID=2006130 RepID=UPI003733CCE3
MALITGYPENETVNGTAGDDTIRTDYNNFMPHRYIFGHGGNDRITVNSWAFSRDHPLYWNTSPLTAGERVDGGAGNDTINGNADQNNLYGGDGNDVIYGKGPAYDPIFGPPEVDDWLFGNAGNDTLYGEGGNDSILGGIGDDLIYGGTGNDTIKGDAGADIMDGGAGSDIYYVDSANDQVRESSAPGTDSVISTVSHTLAANVEKLTLSGVGNLTGSGNQLGNQLNGNGGNNRLNGFAGNDTLNGNSGNDIIDGGIGNDALNGGTGNDRIAGGHGLDRLSGAAGADSFVFNLVSDSTVALGGRDTITDFSRNQGDKIDLRMIDANLGRAGNQAFNFIEDDAFSGRAGQLNARLVNGGTLVSGDVNGDGRADFSILLDDRVTLSADVFLL